MTTSTTHESGPGHQFASDNCTGICPEAWAWLEKANRGAVASYGNDAFTSRACALLREKFETDCEVFFCFNGTAANSVATAHLCQSFHSVICHRLAHLETDECGAPEFFSNGTKILLVDGDQGKVAPEAVEETIRRRTDIHYPKPRILSLTQPTELGTVYRIHELAALNEVARRHHLRIHMDGARLANSLVTLQVSPREITWQVGVDVLCLGGTKNGLPVGEAVIFFDKELAAEFDYRCKQAGQLASKMRFLSAPWLGLLGNDAWLNHARHANVCAQMLAERLRQFAQIQILHPVEANAVFVRMPQSWAEQLQSRGWVFYSFIAAGGFRFMCSWDTREEDIEALLADVCKLASSCA